MFYVNVTCISRSVVTGIYVTCIKARSLGRLSRQGLEAEKAVLKTVIGPLTVDYHYLGSKLCNLEESVYRQFCVYLICETWEVFEKY